VIDKSVKPKVNVSCATSTTDLSKQ